MRPRKRPRIAFAAWLGIVALAIQALIPALLAAEIEIAGQEHGASVFTLCAFGHLHVATTPAEPGGTGTPPHDEELGAPCPICLPPIASPAVIFTTLMSGPTISTRRFGISRAAAVPTPIPVGSVRTSHTNWPLDRLG